MGQQVNVGRELVFAPGAIVTGSWNGSFDRGGTTYYVNNITGSDTADGLSWNNPCDEVSTAVTLSEASRLVHPGTTTNDYIRNTIVVQGTGTAYTAVTALPLYCDLIGLGADSRGTNQGVARIGSDSVTGYGVTCTDTVRGLNVYNMQFQGGSGNYCFTIENMYRSTFDNCSFMTPGATSGQPTAAFHSSVGSGSLVFNHCLIGGTSSSKGTEPAIGMKIAGTSWNNCLVENCFIAGITGVQVASTVSASWGSMFKNNFIGRSVQTCLIGVNDDATSGNEAIVYAGNYFSATTALDLEFDAARAIGNYAVNDFVAAS